MVRLVADAQIGLVEEADAMRRANWIGLVGVLVTMTAAGTDPALGAEVRSAESRVRAATAEAREFLARAAKRSPTVARLLCEIDASDIVVVVEFKRLPRRVNGLVQMAAATASARYVRLSLGTPSGQAELMALLGHELRHVVEIAGMPEIRDEASLAAAYRQAGYAARGDGYFETAAALEAGRTVARELKAGR